ncbi:MAG: outer membrane protein assembly factor [Candidatus Cyclonatronum sp.]|uniref:BamA/TamA family outer membrane protein n=1 Tax=Cyclonatronum sp. TaxID=3024185 RepID=UPI0025BB4945|nr:BamA/TamA family outer membrane protein [Cyclonatronum sp.]MCH8487693.1 outer membrane protein assembly factor [Cyclonatronum sp.]
MHQLFVRTLSLLFIAFISCAEVHARQAPADTLRAPGMSGLLFQAEAEPDAYRNSIVPVPAVAYTPETGLMLGAVVFYQFKPAGAGDETRASQLFATGIYTLKSQIILEGGTTLIRPGETWIHNLYGGYNYFPALYYAPGFDSLDDSERTVEYRRLFLQADFLQNRGNNWYAGPVINFGRVWDVVIPENDDGSIPAAWARGNPENNTIAGLGFSVRFDTRNSIMTPTEGRYFEITPVVNPSVAGSKGFSSMYLDARRYWQPEPLPGTIVAAHFSGFFTTGDVPFQAMPGLGGDNIGRGYYFGRFNDQNVAQLQLELRQHLWWRFGAVAFASAGEVWNRFEDFTLSNPKYAGGAGLRFNLNPRDSMNIRIDYGFGAHGNGLYLTIGEAF